MITGQGPSNPPRSLADCHVPLLVPLCGVPPPLHGQQALALSIVLSPSAHGHSCSVLGHHLPQQTEPRDAPLPHWVPSTKTPGRPGECSVCAPEPLGQDTASHFPVKIRLLLPRGTLHIDAGTFPLFPKSPLRPMVCRSEESASESGKYKIRR